jgi:hypothetical protein
MRLQHCSQKEPQKSPESRNLANIFYKFVPRAPPKQPEVVEHVYMYRQNLYRSQKQTPEKPGIQEFSKYFL